MTTLILLALVQAAPHAGVAVNGLSTWWGPLSCTARRQGNSVTIAIAGGLAATGPEGSVVIAVVPATTNSER